MVLQPGLVSVSKQLTAVQPDLTQSVYSKLIFMSSERISEFGMLEWTDLGEL